MPGHFDTFMRNCDSSLRKDFREDELRQLFSPDGNLTFTSVGPFERDPWSEDRLEDSSDPAADAFELSLLTWLRETLGITPISCALRPDYFFSWEFDYEGRSVEVVVIGKKKNAWPENRGDLDWILRIDEAEPAPFASRIESCFEQVGVRRTTGKDQVRVQYKSCHLKPESDLAKTRWQPNPQPLPARRVPKEMLITETARLLRTPEKLGMTETADPPVPSKASFVERWLVFGTIAAVYCALVAWGVAASTEVGRHLLLYPLVGAATGIILGAEGSLFHRDTVDLEDPDPPPLAYVTGAATFLLVMGVIVYTLWIKEGPEEWGIGIVLLGGIATIIIGVVVGYAAAAVGLITLLSSLCLTYIVSTFFGLLGRWNRTGRIVRYVLNGFAAITILASVVFLAVASHPTGRDRIVGHVRGERFYEDKSLTYWVEALGGNDTEVATSAKSALSQPDPLARQMLDDIFLEDAVDVGILAECLSRHGQEAVPQLTEWLESDRSTLQRAAAGALAKIGAPAAPAVPRLIALLGETVRAKDALQSIGVVDRSELVDLAREPEGEDYSTARKAALAVLEHFDQEGRIPRGLLFEFLSHSHAGVRALAIKRLRSSNEDSPTFVEHLETVVMTYGDPDALDALADLGAKDFLTSALESHPRSTVRAEVARAIGNLDPQTEANLEALVEALDDPDGDVRKSAHRAIGQWKQLESAVPILTAGLKKFNGPGRFEVAELLVERGVLDDQATRQQVVSVLTNELLNKDSGIRKRSIKALRRMGRRAKDAISAITDSFHDPAPEVRREAVVAVTEIGASSPAVIDGLALLLQDPDVDVRIAAAKALGTLRGYADKAVPALINGLKDSEWRVRYYCAFSVGRYGPEAQAAVAPLLFLLFDEHMDVRKDAARSLGEINPTDDRVRLSLLRLLTDEGDVVRYEAAIALTIVAPKSPGIQQILEEAAYLDAPPRGYNDSYPGFIRPRAMEALGRLGLLIIPPEIKARYPKLLELIRGSESMNNEERQYWITFLPVMTPGQIKKLRDILETEKKQLGAIDAKYKKELEAIGVVRPIKERPAEKKPRVDLVIPPEIKAQYPELLELILGSESMNDEERQYWINVLPVMTSDQIKKLRDILETEKKQLAEMKAGGRERREALDLLDKEEFDKAIAVVNRSIQRDPGVAWPFRLRASAYRRKGDQDRAIADYSKAIELEPNVAHSYRWRGEAYGAKGDHKRQIADYRKAVELDPQSAEAHNAMAWLMATCPDEAVRDGKKAIEHATKACELTEWKNPVHLDTLAAAHAEDGQFEKAVEWQEKALACPDIAKQLSEDELAKARQRAKLFKEKKAYRGPGIKWNNVLGNTTR